MSHRMHIRLVVILIVVLLAGCSDHSTDSASVALNQPFPADGATNVPVTAELAWQSAFAPNSGVHYKVAISLLPDPGDADANQQNQSPGGFHPGQTYYWRVEAHFPTGHIFRSPIWRFRTASPYQYPIELGHLWNYSVRSFYTDIEMPDRLVRPLVEDTYHTRIVVDSFGILPENEMPAFRLTESTYGEFIYPSESRNWFNNVSDGLYHYAYDGSGGIAIPRKLLPSSLIVADERISAIMGMSPSIFARPMLSGEYTFEPVRSLAYPMRIGNQWVFMEDSPLGVIQKRVVGIERIQVGGLVQSCWVIKWIYDPSSLDIADDIDFLDYYGSSGLVMRSIVIRDVLYYTADLQHSASATWHQEIVLDSFERAAY